MKISSDNFFCQITYLLCTNKLVFIVSYKENKQKHFYAKNETQNYRVIGK